MLVFNRAQFANSFYQAMDQLIATLALIIFELFPLGDFIFSFMDSKLN